MNEWCDPVIISLKSLITALIQWLLINWLTSAQLDDTMQPLRPYEKKDTLKQFLDHDRHVLRFFCIWDDRDVPFGDPHEMVLHYYLADDTIEVREIIPANSGRDAVPMFLHRGKLPKTLEPMRKPGELADRTVLNVFGPMGHGGRFILDNLKVGIFEVGSRVIGWLVVDWALADWLFHLLIVCLYQDTINYNTFNYRLKGINNWFSECMQNQNIWVYVKCHIFGYSDHVEFPYTIDDLELHKCLLFPDITLKSLGLSTKLFLPDNWFYECSTTSVSTVFGH